MSHPFRSTNLAGGEAYWPGTGAIAPALHNVTPAPYSVGTSPSVTFLSSFPPYTAGTDPDLMTGEGMVMWLRKDLTDDDEVAEIAAHGWHVKKWTLSLHVAISFTHRDEPGSYDTTFDFIEFYDSVDNTTPPPDHTTVAGGSYDHDEVKELVVYPFYDGVDLEGNPIEKRLVLKVDMHFTMARFIYRLGHWAYAPCRFYGAAKLWEKDVASGTYVPVQVEVPTLSDPVVVDEAFAFDTAWRGTLGDTIIFNGGDFSVHGAADAVLKTAAIECTTSKWNGSTLVGGIAPGDSQNTLIPTNFDADARWSATHAIRDPL